MTIKPTRTLVSFDWAMKSILRDKANFDVLGSGPPAVTGRRITCVDSQDDRVE